MSYGEVDTLNMLFEKLDGLLNESQGYYESFLDANTLYKAGKMDEREFFGKMGDYLVACSALEFLSIKAMFELKKALDRGGQGAPPGAAQPGMPPGMAGMPGMPPGMAGMAMRPGTAANPVGAPPSVVSAGEAFAAPGTLPSPDPSLATQADRCASCGKESRRGAKFCTGCGAGLSP
ncbi:MAG: zinc ribbon domain-containing protein [Thaumarchaeota archaeon]|nr:zinc ribbon domain-containing protein [Nitrososphaerota archaeon]RNJ72577.1 MAG: zinc ribbon domain-containing protein [Thaumarchaeota archaeon S13]RNJ74287.1 MAG: zinc ribbon domain-containing protein [Thaumarchaeota archaeon S14]RNJ76929.1 MAG: zinc ribbon domain-containing protein [Thaumarchaeota archaeon S15]MDD9826751.1 zinc ribbon domain-containing protein [Nitrososphaerota archaeon]